MRIRSAKELTVYEKAYDLAMDVFRKTQSWPDEEKYSLIDQIRRSSRSVCTNLREGWAKRRYRANFTSKLTDCDAENSETDTWLDFARDCGYLSNAEHRELSDKCAEIGAMLGSMLKKADRFVVDP
jgi:four helix bundle protein